MSTSTAFSQGQRSRLRSEYNTIVGYIRIKTTPGLVLGSFGKQINYFILKSRLKKNNNNKKKIVITRL